MRGMSDELTAPEDTEDPQRRPWRTARLPPLVGAKGACEILGIHKTTFYKWLRPGSGDLGPDKTYMVPPKYIEAGPVWDRSDVEHFAVEIGRRRALPGEGANSGK